MFKKQKSVVWLAQFLFLACSPTTQNTKTAAAPDDFEEGRPAEEPITGSAVLTADTAVFSCSISVTVEGYFSSTCEVTLPDGRKPELIETGFFVIFKDPELKAGANFVTLELVGDGCKFSDEIPAVDNPEILHPTVQTCTYKFTDPATGEDVNIADNPEWEIAVCYAPELVIEDEDGEITRTTTNIDIDREVLNDATAQAETEDTNLPVLVNASDFNVTVLQLASITGSIIKATDTISSVNDIVFTVVSKPVRGQLRLTGANESISILEVGSSFTQADINSSKLKYRYMRCTNDGDSFAFKVKDGSANFATNASTANPKTIAITASGAPSVGGTYVFIDPSETGISVSDFCAMKFEAKNGGSVATSQASDTPWFGVDRTYARAVCQALGSGYDMLTNAQWQALARNIEGVAANWSSGSVGSGALNRGNADQSATEVASSSDANGCIGMEYTGHPAPYDSNPADDCSASWHPNKRTHTLSNEEVIWDIAGNIWEWVSDDKSDIACSNGGGHVSVQTSPPCDLEDWLPQGDYSSLSSDPYGNLGIITGGLDGAVLRGGGCTDGGVFAAKLNVSSSSTGSHIGWRCRFGGP